MQWNQYLASLVTVAYRLRLLLIGLGKWVGAATGKAQLEHEPNLGKPEEQMRIRMRTSSPNPLLQKKSLTEPGDTQCVEGIGQAFGVQLVVQSAS